MDFIGYCKLDELSHIVILSKSLILPQTFDSGKSCVNFWPYFCCYCFWRNWEVMLVLIVITNINDNLCPLSNDISPVSLIFFRFSALFAVGQIMMLSDFDAEWYQITKNIMKNALMKIDFMINKSLQLQNRKHKKYCLYITDNIKIHYSTFWTLSYFIFCCSCWFICVCLLNEVEDVILLSWLTINLPLYDVYFASWW